MTGRRLKEAAALWMIGDGIVGTVAPRRHTRLWKFGPKGYQRALEKMAKRPKLSRAMYAAEAGLGLLLAMRQFPR